MLEQSFHTLYNAVHVVYFNVKGEKQLGGGRGPAEETGELWKKNDWRKAAGKMQRTRDRWFEGRRGGGLQQALMEMDWFCRPVTR